MIFCRNTNNAIFFSSIEEIPNQIWKELGPIKSRYFHRDFLVSLEKHNPKIGFLYIVLIDIDKKPIAFANIQIVDFYIDSLRNDLEVLVRKAKNIGRRLGVFPHKKPLKVLMCGNTFVSGEHGIFVKENQDKKNIIRQLAKAIHHHININKTLRKEISIFLIKDFIKKSTFITQGFKENNYHPFNAEPNMVLYLHKNWQNFDDYLASMKTKFRVKARKTFKQSVSLRIEDITLNNIDEQLPKMTALYKKVASKANFNLGDFDLETYRSFKQNLKDNYILKAYYLNHKMVGFISGMINKNSLDAHFVGIDYQLNREYAIYQRMLYNYINIAIQRKLEVINFGRTASQIKSSVGAVPQDLTMYIRHKKSITNRILKVFLQRIEPTPFQQKFPFKKTTNENRK